MSKERLYKEILNQKATRREFLGWTGKTGRFALKWAVVSSLIGGGCLGASKLGELLNLDEKETPSSGKETPTPTATVAPQETPTPKSRAQTTNHDLLTPEQRLAADQSYEGIYYHPGELNSSPEHQQGLVHVYGLGEPLNPNYASGLPFQREEFVCASWFYPLGTWLKVTNLANDEVVYCRVKDRGPNRVKYPNIIADLTKGARDEIAPSWVGEIEVLIEPAK